MINYVFVPNQIIQFFVGFDSPYYDFLSIQYNRNPASLIIGKISRNQACTFSLLSLPAVHCFKQVSSNRYHQTGIIKQVSSNRHHQTGIIKQVSSNRHHQTGIIKQVSSSRNDNYPLNLRAALRIII
jgi:hypothetical protein